MVQSGARPRTPACPAHTQVAVMVQSGARPRTPACPAHTQVAVMVHHAAALLPSEADVLVLAKMRGYERPGQVAMRTERMLVKVTEGGAPPCAGPVLGACPRRKELGRGGTCCAWSLATLSSPSCPRTFPSVA